MANDFCGNEAKLEYEVEAPLVGEYAEIRVQRFDRKSLTASGFQELTSTKTEMKWPDQEVASPGHGYCGGRQVDFKGLSKKSYSDKFAKQNFTLSIKHRDQSVDSSSTEIIDELPAAGPDPQVLGMPGQIEQWVRHVRTNAAGVQGIVWSIKPGLPIAGSVYAQPAQKKHNAGRFDIEHKDGVIIITVKISLVSMKPGKGTKKEFKYLKKLVEEFWNSDSQGYNQWIYHRTGCKRLDECGCSVVRNKKGKYLASGCCKLPFKVVIEEGGVSDNIVSLYYLSPGQRREIRINGQTRFQANSYTLSYPENRPGTYAHEVGHMMGFPDQYATGAVVSGAMGPSGPTGAGAWPISQSSVMGSSQNKAEKRHLEAKWFNDWINDKIDEMKVIDKT